MELNHALSIAYLGTSIQLQSSVPSNFAKVVRDLSISCLTNLNFGFLSPQRRGLHKCRMSSNCLTKIIGTSGSLPRNFTLHDSSSRSHRWSRQATLPHTGNLQILFQSALPTNLNFAAPRQFPPSCLLRNPLSSSF